MATITVAEARRAVVMDELKEAIKARKPDDAYRLGRELSRIERRIERRAARQEDHDDGD